MWHGREKHKTKQKINQIENKKSILIYGDYDVDGTTATSILYLFLKSINADVHYYIPSRENEGYGLSKKGIDYATFLSEKELVQCMREYIR